MKINSTKHQVIGLVPALLLFANVETRALDLADLVAPDASARKLAGGFQFVEGPAWSPQGFLVFSDIPANRILELGSDDTTRDFLNPSGKANGLIFDQRGRLYACQGGARQVIRLDPADGKKITPLATAFDGKKLNSPNDLALDLEGGVYFTDPRYGGGEDLEQKVNGVYHVDVAGKVTRVIDDLVRPNGILVSPLGKHLYVANPDKREVWRAEILGPGKLGDKKLIYTGDETLDGGGPDGMAHDAHGNVYATYKGIVVLDPDGKLIGRIAVPEHPANCEFGGKDLKTLYITARTGLYAVDMKVAGAPLFAGAPSTPAQVVKTRESKANTLILNVPESWKDKGGDGQMRAGQLELPAVEGDKEPGELIVYYFGAGGAGGVAANLERWIGQFEEEGRKVKLTQGKARDAAYTLAEVTGTYNKPVGPPIQRQSRPAPAYRMLAAIVDTPSGPYFLKLTGPVRTVTAASEPFRAAFGGNASEETEYKLPE